MNNDFEPCAGREVSNVRTLRYGITNPEGCDYIATDIRYTQAGTAFTVKGPDSFSLDLETPSRRM